MNKMEKILFKKIESWILLLLFFINIVFIISFSWIVRNVHIDNRHYIKYVSDFAKFTSEIPTKLNRIVMEFGQVHASVANRYPHLNGFKNNSTLPSSIGSDEGSILMSYFDEGISDYKIVLKRVMDQKILHEWRPNYSKFGYDHNPMFNPYINPVLLENGSIIFHNDVDIIVVDKYSNVEKIFYASDYELKNFHHSINIDKAGHIYTCGTNMKQNIFSSSSIKYTDDVLVVLDKEGKLIEKKSIVELLLKTNFSSNLLSSFGYDPIHINDVEPALFGGEFWEKGDIFLSLRAISMIALYRPSENKIIWYKVGPWLNQHDVDVIDESRISIFGNDLTWINDVEYIPNGHSDIYIFDFKNNEIEKPFSKILKNEKLFTPSQGLHKITKNNKVYIEETDYGRLMLLEPVNENTLWQYTIVNKDLSLANILWSEYIEMTNFDFISSR